MKLELKHVKSYLDTSVKLLYKCSLGLGDEIDLLGVDNIQHTIHGYGTFDVKMVLRPLSDLTNEIEVKGEKFVPIDLLRLELKSLRLNLDDEKDLRISIRSFTYIDLEIIPLLNRLYEWHFDVYGLIENNLAIDINTLEKPNKL